MPTSSKPPIHTYTARPNRSTTHLPTTLQSICNTHNIALHTSTLHLPLAAIPPGRWTTAFAPSFLDPDIWLLILAVPKDSEFVCFMWPDAGGSQDAVEALIRELVARGEFKNRGNVEGGAQLYGMFCEIVAQAVWAEGEREMLGFDWRSGEWRVVK
ncbi:hypothetical protein CC78DRAFT_571968 [Lojkania enalia]|uniref:Uncharacterized protein n=1 Tax=Lojkania enalia TaxID=147567 RepID=A0A9P4N236_9PLEO|nr:hypothetical protein CC78DRAFT_571968 [Didymosphaeria enalia]